MEIRPDYEVHPTDLQAVQAMHCGDSYTVSLIYSERPSLSLCHVQASLSIKKQIAFSFWLPMPFQSYEDIHNQAIYNCSHHPTISSQSSQYVWSLAPIITNQSIRAVQSSFSIHQSPLQVEI
jgi:hypothetical protein